MNQEKCTENISLQVRCSKLLLLLLSLLDVITLSAKTVFAFCAAPHATQSSN